MRWEKGRSGNPGGRTPLTPTAKLAKTMAMDASPRAIKRLIELMEQDDDRRVAKSASDSLLDRAFGKPAQALQVSQEPGEEVAELPLAEKIAMVRAALAELEKEQAAKGVH